MRAAIYGAGSLGIIIGALMSRNGAQIDLIDSFKENIEALKNKGATVTGFMNFNVPVNALHVHELTGHYDLVFLLTKQNDTHQELQNLLPFLHEQSIICTLQNGIPEQTVAQIVGQERTIGGVVGFGAAWREPGVSELLSSAEAVKHFAFEIGEINGEISSRLLAVQKLLNLAGNTTVLDNLMGIRWSKLLMNTTFSGMSAALDCTFGDLIDNPQAMHCVAYLADETIKVAHALAYSLVPMNELEMEALTIDSQSKLEQNITQLQQAWEKHRRIKPSMAQDLEKGRACEIDYINGVVSQLGKANGIATPFNDLVITLVKEAEAEKRVNHFDNLSRFDSLLKQAPFTQLT